MKMKSNKLKDVISFIRNELQDKYMEQELNNFVYLLCEKYLDYTNKADVFLNRENTLSESLLLKFHFATKELKKNRPIQYIIGKTQFLDIELVVNNNVLIPRPETEEIVQWLIENHEADKNEELNILDIGTGSGCIAISLKKVFENAQVLAIDISEKALEVARNNAQKNNVDIKFIKFDILENNLNVEFPQFEIIISNPPYVTISEKQQMSPNVVDYEPALSLFVEDELPLIFYEKIVVFSKEFLKSDGNLYFEINKNFDNQLVGLLEGFGFKDIILKKDINGKERMIKCTKK